MYYIIRWDEDTFLVYDASTQLLSEFAAYTVLDAISLFNDAPWSIPEDPNRFIFTEDAVLEHNTDTGEFKRRHSIAYKLPSIELSYLQQHYPELLI